MVLFVYTWIIVRILHLTRIIVFFLEGQDSFLSSRNTEHICLSRRMSTFERATVCVETRPGLQFQSRKNTSESVVTRFLLRTLPRSTRRDRPSATTRGGVPVRSDWFLLTVSGSSDVTVSVTLPTERTPKEVNRTLFLNPSREPSPRDNLDGQKPSHPSPITERDKGKGCLLRRVHLQNGPLPHVCTKNVRVVGSPDTNEEKV